MGKHHEFVLNLRRNSPTEQWGFSLVGGSDVKTPLIVTRVSSKQNNDYRKKLDRFVDGCQFEYFYCISTQNSAIM